MVTKKLLILIFTLLVLAGLCIYINRDWFARESIQVSHRVSPRPTPPGRRAGPPVFFNLNGTYRLTSVKVIPVSDIETNKYPHPIWELVAQSNSVPTGEFTYGASIRGMHAKVSGARPDPLEPGVKYRLFIEAGSLKAEHDFSMPPKQP